jgi:hypothetical protein
MRQRNEGGAMARFCVLFVAGLLLAAFSGRAQPVFLPGSDIGLVLMPGMVAAENMAGFVGPGPTIVTFLTLGDGPADVAEITAHFAQRLVHQGIRETGRRNMQVAGSTAILWEGIARAERHGQIFTVVALALILAAPERSFAVNVSMPLAEATPEKRAAIEAMLKSVVIRPADPIGARAALPFRFNETERLRVNRLMGGVAAILAPHGAGDTGAASSHLPRLVIELSPNPIDATAGTLEAHARAVMDRARPNRDRGKDSVRRVLIAGGPGVVLLANDPDADGTRAILWFAYARDHRPLMVLAWAPGALFDGMLPEFQAVVDSISLR